MPALQSSVRPTRRTRIVCISDTHNQTPALPKGDVLIHAGDLSNQGSHSELKKTVAWLEKADFEVKIVVAGNHDITLDADFYEQNWTSFHNQQKQDTDQCRKLLQSSPTIIYLQHESQHVRLTSSTGPKTHFTVFGSPYSPAQGRWGFGYTAKEAAEDLWSQIPDDADIVVTHTPPKDHCDQKATQGRAGCEALLHRLHAVCPMLHVCGHLHESRGVERVCWNETHDCASPQGRTDYWVDPGVGNNKLCLVDLTDRDRSRWTSNAPFSIQENQLQADNFQAMSQRVQYRDEGLALTNRASAPLVGGIAMFCSHGARPANLSIQSTCIVNAAITATSRGGPKRFNKPIVVDLDLHVWETG